MGKKYPNLNRKIHPYIPLQELLIGSVPVICYTYTSVYNTFAGTFFVDAIVLSDSRHSFCLW